MKSAQNKQDGADSVMRVLAWTAIFGAIAAFWTGIGLALAAWLR